MDTKCRIGWAESQLLLWALLLTFSIIEARDSKEVAVNLDRSRSTENGLPFEAQILYRGDVVVFQSDHGSRGLHNLRDEEAFRSCDFSEATTLDRTDESSQAYKWQAEKEGMHYFATRTQAPGKRSHCEEGWRWSIFVREAEDRRRQSVAMRRLQQAPAGAPATPAPVAATPPPVTATPTATPPVSSPPPAAATPPASPPPASPPPATPPPVATPPPASPPPATPPPATPPPATPPPATPPPVATPTPSASPPAPPLSPTPATSPTLTPGPSTSPPAPSVPTPSPLTPTVSTTGSPSPAGNGAATVGAVAWSSTVAGVAVFLVAMLQ